MAYRRKVTARLGASNPLEKAVETRDKSTLTMVRDAVRHRHVMLAYQPVVTARNPSKPAFYEGLIRVLDETGRIIPAKDFIREVEETETGRDLDCIALEKGLRALAKEPGLRLSINMSARSIGYQRWMRILNRGLTMDSTVAERLILEITETSAILVPELVGCFMKDLQRRGISFALDDFGAGYTSFKHFRDFQFDILKIDGQFIHGIHESPDNQILVSALISIGRHFDMYVVAEHVETAVDAKYLSEIGIDCLQGYYFGAPTVSPAWETEKDKRASA